MRTELLLAALSCVGACNRGTTERDAEVPAPSVAAAPATDETIESVEPSKPPPQAPAEPILDLTWDKAVGWEPRIVFPPGETRFTRVEGKHFVNLRSAAWDDAELNKTLLAALTRSLETTAVVIPHERLCEPALAAALTAADPAYLMVRIDGDPTERQWDCLQSLGDFDLYLGLCPNVLPSFWGCDGDAQLTALTRRPKLRQRIRALGVGFADPDHWPTLTRFPRLSMLAVRGPAVRHGPDPLVAELLCELPTLQSVDLFDAGQPGSNPQLPPACAFGLLSYSAWYLLDGDPEWGLLPTPVDPSVPCRLRHALFWSLDDPSRAALDRCPDLTLEVVQP